MDRPPEGGHAEEARGTDSVRGIGQVGLGIANSGEANLSGQPTHCDEYYEKRCFGYR